jgi:hypothetical protein
MSQHHPDRGYDGPAELIALSDPAGPEPAPLAVQVTLRGVFQPIDGRYHWHGRLAADPRVDQLGRSGARVVLATPQGRAEGRLSDMDPWGRYRIAGVGRPPFPIDRTS